MKLEILSALNAERAARRAVIVVTDVASGAQRLVKAAEISADPLKVQLEERLRSGKSGMVETSEGRAFLTVHVDKGLFVDKGGYELVLTLAAVTLALAVVGAGRVSADGLFFGKRTSTNAT